MDKKINPPVISVIIPVYNRKDKCLIAVDSVLKQSYKNFEIIVIDDGSSDDLGHIIKARYNHLSRGKLVYDYQQNRGVSSARNKGIKKANGEYIAFLDSDDIWHKKKLEIQMNFLNQNPHLRIYHTNEKWVLHGRHHNQSKHHQKYGGWIFEKILTRCLISPSTIILHKNIFNRAGLFDETLPVCEDYDLWLRISLAFEIGFIDKILITKTGGHDDQLSRNITAIDRYRIFSLEKILKHELISQEQRNCVLNEMTKKVKIIHHGAVKRSNSDLLNWCKQIVNKYKLPCLL